jgi:bifunctional UDP-N-acetylglucosamine pyrophosphorylase/glucosamine-1-phosphate N-acetyltransferase
MNGLTTVILAAGEGKRMRSRTPKVLHPLCGRPLIAYALRLARTLADRVVLVVGPNADAVRAVAGDDVTIVEQRERLGTGHAVLQARAACPATGPLLVMAADMPLLLLETLERLVEHQRTTRAAATILTALVDRPHGYGRVLRLGGRVKRIVEECDATDDQKKVNEVNTSVYCFDARRLWPALGQLKPDNDQGELYLTDVVEQLAAAGAKVEAVSVTDPVEALGVNDRRQLAELAAIQRRRVLDRLMVDGVTVIDPGATYVDVDVEVGEDSVLYPGTFLEGTVRIGERCAILPGSRIRDSTLDDEVTVLDGAVVLDSHVGRGETVPAHARLEGQRPGEPSRIAVTSGLDLRVRTLLEAGARIPRPESVVIGPEVRLEQIVADGLVLHPGTKISGERTIVLGGVELGYEEPVTLENAVLGRRVKVHGGFVQDSVLLEGCEVRQGFHGRAGCLLEEDSYFAHNVGLKMTIVFPFVVLGSLINFCDCLLAGGTSRKHHSEVGSGFIHFNFSPRGDKATPSAFGDVPRGVMLDQPPIFLGGLAGVVGPSRVGFGSVLAAGTVYRADYDAGVLVLGERKRDGSTAFRPRALGAIGAKVTKNVLYLAELSALWAWYRHARPRLAGADALAQAVIASGLRMVEANVDERLKQLDRFRDLVKDCIPAGASAAGESPLAGEWRDFVAGWDRVRAVLGDFREIEGRTESRDEFCRRLTPAASYTAAIQGLSAEDRRRGVDWLASVRAEVMDRCRAALPLITAETH